MTVEYRVGVINGGTPHGPLYLPANNADHAEQRRKGWASWIESSPVDVWIETRTITPWKRVP